MLIMDIIANNFGTFIAILGSAITLIWHLINQYFAFLRIKEQVKENRDLISTNTQNITNTTQTILGLQRAITTNNDNLKNEILLQVAEQDKKILFQLADQERRNGEHSLAFTKVLGDIQKQLEIMNVNFIAINENVKTVSNRTESMERERLTDLKDQLDQLRNHKNEKK